MSDEEVKFILPFFLSSESSSDSDIDELQILLDESDSEEELVLSKLMRKRQCIRGYLEEVVPSYSEEEFKRHFRINKSLYEDLCEKFETSEVYQELRADKRCSARKHLAVFLWFAGHEACSFRDLSDRFDLSLSTISCIIDRTTMFLSNMAPDIIRWPNEEKKKETSTFFKTKTGFSKVIGAIDGTHVVIDPPSTGKDDYIDQKGNISLCLQAICDEKRKFIDIFVGFPGSSHDSWVFQNSFIYPKLRGLCGDYYILGDSAYPCMENLLTPYRDNGHLTKMQKNYNVKLSSGRVVIEHSFGILKQRFRQLYYCKLRGIKKLCHFIRACCVLHNLAKETDLDIVLVDEPDAGEEDTCAEDNSAGKAVREKVCREL